MTGQEIYELLETMGLDPEVRDRIMSQVDLKMARGETVTYADVDAIAAGMGADLEAEGLPPEVPDALATAQEEVERTAQEQYELAQTVAQKQETNQPLSDEEREALEGDSEVQSMVAQIMGRLQVRMPAWLTDPMQGGMWSLTPDQIDYAEMWGILEEFYGDKFQGVERMPGQSYEEWASQSMQNVLANSNQNNPAIRNVVTQYKENIGQVGDDYKIGPFDAYQVMQAADLLGLSAHQAKNLGVLGKAHGLDLTETTRLFRHTDRIGAYTTPTINERKPFNPYEGIWTGDRSAYEQRKAELESQGYRGTDWDEYARVQQGRKAYQVVTKYQGLRESYGGSEVLAIIGMKNEDLASRMYDDPYSLSMEELREAEELAGDPNEYASAFDRAGATWIQSRMTGGDAAGGGTTITVDRAGAAEAAKTLAAAWNMPGLSEAQVNSIVGAVVGPQIAAARKALGNPFKPDLSRGGGPRVIDAPSPYAAAAEQMRGTAAYEELFGNLRDGETEEQYATRFNSESQAMLGDVDLDAARAGMRSGRRKTVGQAALMSGAGSDNSTFRQKLALLGQAFREET